MSGWEEPGGGKVGEDRRLAGQRDTGEQTFASCLQPQVGWGPQAPAPLP